MEHTEGRLNFIKTALSLTKAIAAQRWKKLFENESVHDLVYSKKTLEAIRYNEQYRKTIEELVYYRDEV